LTFDGTSSLSAEDEAALWDLEARFWTSGTDSARATTASNAVMILPYPPGILRGDRLWPRLSEATGWRSVQMTDRTATGHDILALLAYRVSAEKSGPAIHEAYCASTYLRSENGWLRVSHQQTPIA
jgi:hypothetical protein